MIKFCCLSFIDIALTLAATDIPTAGPSAKVLQICCGRSHTMVLMDDGKGKVAHFFPQ